MRKTFTILLLTIAAYVAAMVPPRDPALRAAWAEQNNFEVPNVNGVSGEKRAYAPSPSRLPAVGTRTIIPRVLVIMVNFQNFSLISDKSTVDSLFNGLNWTTGGATGSVRQYFYDQSAGQYNPKFDIVGPVTLSENYGYYGEGASRSKNVGYMVTDACALVNDSVDFSQYDSDDDGNVDLVFIYYAGFGENDPPEFISPYTDMIWPAYWNVVSAGYGNNERYFDGKYIYACEYTNELDGYSSTADNYVRTGIGTICHEFGHALGLPDLYTTNNATHKTLGAWDVMCYGLYNNDLHTPAEFSAYERFFMGWLTPTIITRPDTLTLEPLSESNTAYLISENDSHNLDGVSPDTAVFYLLENKRRIGWGAGFPGEGLLLTRINYQVSQWKSNTVNNTATSMGVDIIEADGLTPSTKTDAGWYGKAGDAFPEGATAYDGIADHVITDISLDDHIISFVYRGGEDPDKPTDIEAQQRDNTQCAKLMDAGQIIIRQGDKTYNILGQRLK